MKELHAKTVEAARERTPEEVKKLAEEAAGEAGDDEEPIE
jgi:hypothetical protein